MASAGGIRAGAAYVELFVKDNRLTKGLAAAAAKLKAFGAGLTGLGTQLLGVGAALATPFALAAKLFADMGSDLVDMSQRTGVSVEALSELGFAAEQSGADMETLEAGLRKMQKFVVEAADGSQTARAALEKLGLTVADLKAIAPDEQFKLIAERLSKVENPTQWAALAMDVFGKSGTWDFTAWIARTFAFAIEKLFKAAAWVADKLGFETFARKLRENFDFSDENINRNRDRIKNQILDERLRRQREADAARKANAAEAMDDVKKAADDLRDSVKEAERKRADMRDRVPPKAKSGSMSSLDEVIDLSKKVDVQGTFNALAVRGLGGESANERAAKAVDQINDNVKKIAVAATHGGLVFV